MGKKWKKWEDSFLKSHNQEMTHKEKAEKLGRTEMAVQTRVSLLGIRKEMLWTKKEINCLIINYFRENVKELSNGRLKGRTIKAIEKRVQLLGLKKGRKWYYIQPRHMMITPNLGYILGATEGDGRIRYDNVLSLSASDKDFVLTYKKAVEEQFEIERKLHKVELNNKNKKWRNQYYIQIGYSEIGKFIKDFDLNKILKAPNPIKCAFLRGMYDAEGCIILSKNRIINNINLTNTDKPLINIIQKLLSDLEINYNIYSREIKSGKIRYDVRLTNRDNFIKFRDNIGFSIKRKQDRLMLLPREYKNGGRRLKNEANN